jgi:hypothetical protein
MFYNFSSTFKKMNLGPGSSIPNSTSQRRQAWNELRLYSTAVLLVIAESGNDEVSKRALAVLKERGLDERSSAAEWASAWRSTNALMESSNFE